MNDSVKKVLGTIYRVYSIFCMCMTGILLVAAIVLWINFGKITNFLISNFPGLQQFF